MSVLVTPYELAELRTLTPYLDIKPVPRHVEKAAIYYLRGFSLQAAARAAGMQHSGPLKSWVESPEGNAVLEYVRGKHMQAVNVTRETITTMLFEAHAKAANATEEIAALKELGKLHDLYKSDERKTSSVNIQVNNTQINNHKQLERMSDEQLMALAGDIVIETSLGKTPPEPPKNPPLPEGYEEDIDV